MAGYQFTWEGEAIAVDVRDAAEDALEQVALMAMPYLMGLTPVRTGFLRSTSFVEVVPRGALDQSSPRLIIGQKADYASYVELGTGLMPGHLQITTTALFVFPRIPEFLKAAIQSDKYEALRETETAIPGEPHP